MAYYDALVAAWNSATQPPTGVTGTGLTGPATSQKLAAINGWTVTGSVPNSFFVTGNQLLNCINYAEFKALTAAQQANLLALCQVPGNLLGGSNNTAFIVDGMFLDYFTNHAGPTITALTALAQTSVVLWWQNNNYTATISRADLVAAGGLT